MGLAIYLLMHRTLVLVKSLGILYHMQAEFCFAFEPSCVFYDTEEYTKKQWWSASVWRPMQKL